MEIAVAVALVGSILAVDYWIRREPLDQDEPLNVDLRLPLPWAGYASSVFSLTALYGSYLGIYILLGSSALVGLALGSILGLVWLDRKISKTSETSFDQFLKSRRFSIGRVSNSAHFLLLRIMLIGLAVSELLIFRELSAFAFSMDPRHATIFVMAIALVCYLYCLIGGYGALFRTDIVQYILVLLMAFVLGPFALLQVHRHGWNGPAIPLAQDMWFPGPKPLAVATPLLNFIVGALTGCCYVIANPDIWKRVFLSANVKKTETWARLTAFVVAGFTPFLLLLPCAALIPSASLDTIGPFDLFLGLREHRALLAVAALGIVASFMSSFDSCLIVAVHLGGTRNPRGAGGDGWDGLARYRIQMASTFVVVAAAALALSSTIPNPYIVAASLLGFFGLLGGWILGTGLLTQPTQATKFPLLSFAAVVAWIVFILQQPEVVDRPVPEIISVFPYGMALFALIAIGTWSSSRRKPKC